MSFLQRVAGFTHRDRVRNSTIWEGLRVELLLLCVGSVEVIQASSPDVFWTPPRGSAFYIEPQGGELWETQDTLKRLYPLAGLGTTLSPKES